MSIYQILCLFGFPSLFLASIGVIHKRFKDVRDKQQAVMLGVQALLRAKMIDYNDEWSTKGYAPLHVKDSFENVWIRYEALGENGVMQAMHDDFMELPLTAPSN